MTGFGPWSGRFVNARGENTYPYNPEGEHHRTHRKAMHAARERSVIEGEKRDTR